MDETREETEERMELASARPEEMALPTAPVAVEPIAEAAEVASLMMEEAREAMSEVMA